ncbi:MAG TPA: methyltransferase domain-containing protein [Myxococcota bacterium]|nr:methyltransferase domain-containing protein [Myxococcota bacterium]
MEKLARARDGYAERIRALAGLRSPALLRGLSRVPREEFLGPPPWRLLTVADLGRGYRETSDPAELYDNVLVALDAERRLNNGEPAALLRWLDSLELRAGERFLHVGCGVGYYTAIAAEALRPGGRALGVELDPSLAERARHNLAGRDDVEIVSGDGASLTGQSFDAIFVNAGATEILPAWLDSLLPGGRLLLPLTVGIGQPNLGVGFMLLVRRDADGDRAEFQGPVGVFHCAGARSEYGESQLRRLFAARPSGALPLRRQPHREDSSCALHGAGFCLAHPARHE